MDALELLLSYLGKDLTTLPPHQVTIKLLNEESIEEKIIINENNDELTNNI